MSLAVVNQARVVLGLSFFAFDICLQTLIVVLRLVVVMLVVDMEMVRM